MHGLEQQSFNPNISSDFLYFSACSHFIYPLAHCMYALTKRGVEEGGKK